MPTTVASLQAVLDLDKRNFDKGIKGAGDKLSKFASGAALGVAAGGVAAVGAGLIATGKAAFDMQKDLGKATALARTQLGLTESEAANFEAAMLDIFENNFGESFEDIGDSLGTVRKNLKNLDDDQIREVTKQALALRDAFDQDVNEVTRTASQLMKNMGLTGQEAMDLITAGFQSGGDVSGDLLDTLNEYSDDFGRLGLTADESLGLINRGLEAGILNTDKIGDLINEFGINLRDPAVLSGIAEIDEGIAGIVSQFQAGELGEREAFEGIIAGLKDVDDQILQDQAGVLLFRSLWEDLGADAVTALGDIKASAQDTSGATDQLRDQYSTLGSVFETLGKKALTALQPITGEIQRQIDETLPNIEAFGGGAFDAIDPFVSRIATLLDDTNALGQTFENLNTQLAYFAPIVKTGLAPLGVLLTLVEKANELFQIADDRLNDMGIEFGTANFLFEQMLGIVSNILLPFTAITDAIRDITNLLPQLSASWEVFTNKLAKADDLIPDWLKPGSPPPLQTGLEGIGDAIRDLPDLSALTGAGAAGNTVNVNIGGVSATTNNAGDPNNEAIRLTLQLLRSQLEAAG